VDYQNKVLPIIVSVRVEDTAASASKPWERTHWI